MTLFELLLRHYKTRRAMAEGFGVTPPAVQCWQESGVPEHIAQIASLSNEIDYHYQPSDYNRVIKGLTFKKE